MRKIVAALGALLIGTTAASASEVWVTMDQVHPHKLDVPAQNIVVGNPSIADVTVQDGQNILLFGNAPGLTNIYFFDENGETIDNMIVRVRSASSKLVTVHKGSIRSTYSCTGVCEQTAIVGDDAAAVGQIQAQAQARIGQAAEAGESE